AKGRSRRGGTFMALPGLRAGRVSLGCSQHERPRRASSICSASVVFFGAISQCRAALLDKSLELAAHVLACGILSFQILLQAVHVIDAGTDLRERGCIAPARPQTGQEISGDEAERERENKA